MSAALKVDLATRVGIFVAILLVAVAGFIGGVCTAPDVRAAVMNFVDARLSWPPTHGDAHGIHKNTEEAMPKDGLRVAIYNGDSRSRLYPGAVGGDRFAAFAKQKPFDYRINASTYAEALKSLRELRRTVNLPLSLLAIVDHAGPALPTLGNTLMPQEFIAYVRAAGLPDGRSELLFCGCSVGRGAVGESFLKQLSRDTGWTVGGSTNTTVVGASGVTWDLLRARRGQIITP